MKIISFVIFFYISSVLQSNTNYSLAYQGQDNAGRVITDRNSENELGSSSFKTKKSKRMIEVPGYGEFIGKSLLHLRSIAWNKFAWMASWIYISAGGQKNYNYENDFAKTSEPVGCGKQAPKYAPHFKKRIINGVEAKPHSWPWQINLNIFYNFFWQQDCGGILIRAKDNVEKSDAVLTAGHCATKFNEDKLEKLYDSAYAVAGMHDKEKTEPLRQQRVSYKTTVNPYYEHDNDAHHGRDIALLFFEEPFIFTDTVRPICLPINGFTTDQLIGKNCWTTGWGAYIAAVPHMPATTLQQMRVAVLPDLQCIEIWGALEYRSGDMICGRNENASFYIGDSGGPLQCEEEDGSWTVYGMVSKGGENHTIPMVFARLNNDMVKWIQDTVANYTRV